jgi:hypothetical protein
MIISEKQLFQLMCMAHDLRNLDVIPEGYKNQIVELLMCIARQQSEELKVVK